MNEDARDHGCVTSKALGLGGAVALTGAGIAATSWGIGRGIKGLGKLGTAISKKIPRKADYVQDITKAYKSPIGPKTARKSWLSSPTIGGIEHYNAATGSSGFSPLANGSTRRNVTLTNNHKKYTGKR